MLNRKICFLAPIAVTLFLVSACSQTDETSTTTQSNGGAVQQEAPVEKAAVIDEKILDAVAERQAVFKLMKQNFVPLYLMSQEKMPFNADAAQTHAARVNMLVGMIEENFKTDTRNLGVTTDALDNIWAETEKFQQKIEAAKVAAKNLTAATGDMEQLKPAFGRMGKACGSCHDDYRQDDD